MLAQISSLEGEGARGADNAFAGSGVEKPTNVQTLLQEEKDQALQGLLGNEERSEAAEGEEEAEAEEEAPTLEEAMEEYQDHWDDCMAHTKAFISFFQVRRVGPRPHNEHLQTLSTHFARPLVGRGLAQSARARSVRTRWPSVNRLSVGQSMCLLNLSSHIKCARRVRTPLPI